MSYTALYRKFRPENFSEVKGQDHIVTTLKNQLKAGRIGHAYLFTGTRGTGKTSVAKIFARAVNCENPTEDGPCGECRTCKAILSGASMNVIEMDAASNNGVDNIREIVDEVSYSPTEGKYKVYIIDEVHMLSTGAFNALLKTLEEPPSYVIFILATTEVHKLPITILSRCQRYDFKRITIDTLVDRMKELMDAESIDVEEKAFRYVAKTADGSLRDALSLLDQCIAFNLGETLTYDKALDVLGAVDTEVFSRLLRNILAADVLGCVNLLEEIIMQGRELTQFVTDFTWYLRNLLLLKSSDELENVIEVSSENLKLLKEEAEKMDINTIVRYIKEFSDLSGKIRYASQKRVLVEIALIKMCKPQMEVDTDALLDRVRQVEDKLESGVVVAAGAVHSSEAAPADVARRKVELSALPEATREDIEAAYNKWNSIVGCLEPIPRNCLKKAKISISADNKLMVVLSDDIGADYFNKNNGENKAALNQAICEFTGRNINVEYMVAKNEREFEAQPDAFKMINFNIEMED